MEKEELLPFAYGAKGIGEIATIPTAPAAQGAYYARDHVLQMESEKEMFLIRFIVMESRVEQMKQYFESIA